MVASESACVYGNTTLRKEGTLHCDVDIPKHACMQNCSVALVSANSEGDNRRINLRRQAVHELGSLRQ